MAGADVGPHALPVHTGGVVAEVADGQRARPAQGGGRVEIVGDFLGDFFGRFMAIYGDLWRFFLKMKKRPS